MQSHLNAFRGSFLHCVANPANAGEDAVAYFDDGILLIENGRVVSLGNADNAAVPADCTVHDLTGKLLVPGFIDTHVHYPQVDVIASHGTQLLQCCLLYTSPSPRDKRQSRMPSSA